MTSLAHRVLSSSANMLIIRLTQRSLGLISTLVLARLLTPADFGLVAIVAIVVQFFDIVATSGSTQYIIQKADLHDDDLNTAWTIDLLMKGGLQLILIAAAPTVADYYDKPELQMALWIASCSLPISALLNPGLTLLKKQLDYRRILRLSIIQKLLSFTVVMTVVLIEPSFWALIIGDLVSSAAFTLGSYLIHQFRPRLSLSQIRTQWNFSQWMLLKSVFGYTRSHIDTLLVSRSFGVAEVGKYHMVKHLTSIPATDIISPAIEPLLSAFSLSKKHQPDALPQQVRIALLVILFLIMPLCVFIWHYPAPIIDTLLGSQWTSAYGVLSALSLLLFAFSLNQLFESYCISQGRVKQVFGYDVASMICVVGVLFFFPGDSLNEFALHRGLLGAATALGFFLYINHSLRLGIVRLISLTVPIVLGCLVAVWLSALVDSRMHTFSLVHLVYLTAVFFPAYLVTAVILYALFYRTNNDVRRVQAFVAPAVSHCIRGLRCWLTRHG
ncbi:oligosaccharide flippase family protein [Marinobacter changyiensis]|uniref:oligosaccharide flippase family protein n=1 Tax=Marinobacter changyiensis TaxID=2604091 RepID=UPI001263FAC4|nr:oligosaccharide flippase family protein [Marinobacter changyiensis]